MLEINFGTVTVINHRWRKARCCSSRTIRKAALPVVRGFGGMKKYTMTNTRAVPSIFGMKQPKVKDRKEITYICKLEC
jgi:hypothetical protein